MASHEYRSRSSSNQSMSNDPFWLLLSALFAVLLFLVGFPALLAGFFGQRYVSRLLSRFGRQWSALVWFVPAALGMLLLLNLLDHGLQQMIQRELADYFQSGKHYQADLARWNWGRLWSETWPVWARTLEGAPVWGLWFEIVANTKGGQTGQMLVQREQDRERRMERAQAAARKRTRHPERLPDAVADQMVIGVPVDGDEEHE